MNNLLTQRHPDILDIGREQASKILKYTSLDTNGNVIECLQRKSTDTDFVDVTDVERERVKLIQVEKELKRAHMLMKEMQNDTASYITY